MSSSKTFQLAFLISLIVHGVVLFQNPNFNLFPNSKKQQNLEISYIKEPEKPIKYQKTLSPNAEPFLKLPSKITVDKIAPPPFIDKPEVFQRNRETIQRESSFIRPALTKPDIIAVKKKITLPALDLDKSNNPSYISYYQIVREKIKRAAYQNYTRIEMGEVYLSFIISSDGYIREVRIVDEKSSFSPYLRQIALKSVKDASPFPNFPKDLNYQQLSFNVVISFEAE